MQLDRHELTAINRAQLEDRQEYQALSRVRKQNSNDLPPVKQVLDTHNAILLNVTTKLHSLWRDFVPRNQH